MINNSPDLASTSVSTLPSLAIVVPCFNEEEVLKLTVDVLSAKLAQLIESHKINEHSYIYFVDDGSSDNTWALIDDFSCNHQLIRGIKLSRNKGHQLALLAGLFSTNEDMVISIDADLQDDTDVIDQMVDRYGSGDDIVYGVRSTRDTDSKFKRLTAESYYSLLDKMGVEIVYNHADFRLMSKRAINSLREFPESNVFLRGLIPQLGFRTSIVSYSRLARQAGETKYPVSKMLKLAWEGVTSFSVMPLRLITSMGLIVSLISLSLTFWVLYLKIFTQSAIPGWSSILLPILFIGGVQLISLGIIGEYIAKIFTETKARPKYIIEKKTYK
jgi:glycosyltransferase involved in cell wall biosynthesis